MPASVFRSDPGKHLLRARQKPFHSCSFSHRVACEWLKSVAKQVQTHLRPRLLSVVKSHS